MLNIASLLKSLKYAPQILGIVNQMRTKQNNQSHILHDTESKIADIQGQLLRKIEKLEENNANLSHRLKEIDTAFATIKVVVWTSAVFVVVAAILALAALLK